MSYKLPKVPKFLGGKSKKKEKIKEQDALRRQHLTSNQEFVVVPEEQPSTIEDYYKAKQEARDEASEHGVTTASISNDRFISKYQSAHADRFDGRRAGNFDEDDEGGEAGVHYGDLRRDFLQHLDGEADPVLMPTRA
jgi:hypothetical protein